MKDALLATLVEEYSAVEAFASILTLETKALTALSPLELLPPIVEQKTELIGVLARLETTRDGLLAEMGFPAGWPGTRGQRRRARRRTMVAAAKGRRTRAPQQHQQR
jgi:flagella synthesis protein FlgN